MTYKFQSDPDHYRQGVGLYVKFLGDDSVQMYVVDPAAGDEVDYGSTSTLIVKHEAEGVRRIRLQNTAIAWSKEIFIDIKYKALPVKPVDEAPPVVVNKRRRGRPRKKDL